MAQQQPDHFAASVLETVLVGRHPHLGRWGWEGPEDEAQHGGHEGQGQVDVEDEEEQPSPQGLAHLLDEHRVEAVGQRAARAGRGGGGDLAHWTAPSV